MAEIQETKNQRNDFVEGEDTRTPDVSELKVSSKNDKDTIKRLASTIFSKFKEHGYVKLRCIGPAAVGNGFKAYTIARPMMMVNDFDTCATGAFFEVRMRSGDVRDGIIINIEAR